MADVARVFIGYDDNETVAFHVLAHSIMRNSSIPVTITPIVKRHMAGFYDRERSNLESTDFSFTRFLTPYLCGYEGWAAFMDCDMLMLGDIADLWSLRDDRFSVMCVKHDYRPVEDTKFLGQIQTKYEKKNWSSVMLFNNAKCRVLTPDVVASVSPPSASRSTMFDQVGRVDSDYQSRRAVHARNPRRPTSPPLRSRSSPARWTSTSATSASRQPSTVP